METPDDAETKLPSDLPAYPSITFSSGDSWRQVAEEYGKIVDKQITGADLKSLVGKLIAGKVSRDEKAAAILAYLDREVRYTGVEFGESAMVPHSPNETLGRKYGDCKDKASLLAAMLRVANIPRTLLFSTLGAGKTLLPIFPAWACSITPSFMFRPA